ncbi:MAG TPA: ATP-dependent RecD-like DNA helicase [Candidatus Binatia bacterium]
MAETLRDRSLLQGTITRITYQDAQAPYTVARLQVDGVEQVTVVGGIYPVSEGEEIKVSGSWKTHPRYGLQFQAERWEKIEPATLEGIEKYLGSGLIKGIGPTYARRLVSAFGLDTLKVLSEEPERVREVSGIGRMRARKIVQAWQDQRGMQDVMVFLQGHGVGSALSLRIYRAFGAETVARVKENPYCLAEEVYGVGFILADRIAATLGISGAFPLRVQAGLLHVARKFSDDGHCYVPLTPFKANAAALLGIDEDAVEPAIGRLAAEGKLVLEKGGDDGETRVYPRELYDAERRVAAALRRLLATPTGLSNKALKGRGDLTLQLAGSSSVLLEPEQREAISQALKQKVLVITGGPGTGKTTLLIALLKILQRSEISFALAAPTGRAAKRMAELSGEEARTIHRLLEFNPHEGGFQRGEDNPIDADVIIIDEASMLDLPLMDHLLQAISPASHLILIGDVDQLPSVGPGSVLRDLIGSKAVPVVVLRRIFRQAGESLIVQNAHRILHGEPLMLEPERGKRDFVFVPREREEEALEVIQELVKERIPRRLGAQDVQLLTPMHRGLLGTVHLNRELQRLLNPDGKSIERAGMHFRAGDRVMQLRNNYDKGIFNGDLGKIVTLDAEEGELAVDFDGRVVSYDLEDLDEISLAYATSIHKSQGSEYPAVVIALHTSHFPMLHRSILYTAVTRGKELVVLVGSKRALAMAIKNVRIEQRCTGLKERLKGYA